MASESRPVCVYAMASLNKNSTKMMISMCIGIALALYGVYVQARIQSNPSYMPSIAMAPHWLYNRMGNKFMLASCKQNSYKQTMSGFLMRSITRPVVHYSGVANGMISVAQIITLKVHSKSIMSTNAIIALSAIGWTISMICLGGSYATCKLMCISCLGIHHIVIIYLAFRRRKIIRNMLCSPTSLSEGACTYGSSSDSAGTAAASNAAKSVFGAQSGTNARENIRRRLGRSYN